MPTIYLFNPYQPHGDRTICYKIDGGLTYLKPEEVLSQIRTTREAFKTYGQKVKVIPEPPKDMADIGYELTRVQLLQYEITPKRRDRIMEGLEEILCGIFNIPD